MAHVLAYTSPARGHLYPLIPVLDELHRRGHQIAVRTLASQVPLMRARGFSASAISGRVEAVVHQDWRGRNTRQALAIAVRAFCARAEYDDADLRQAIGAGRPDAILVDINSWGALATAERWGGPWAVFCPYPLALRSRDVPPFGPGLPPAHGPLGRARDRLLRPLVLGTIEKTMLPPLNGVRAAAGLPPLSEADEFFRRPPLLLYMTAEPFEYPRRDWPGSVLMVGPCAWEPPASPPQWLSAVGEPVVLVTTSSEFQNDLRLVDVALEALAGEPVHVVATLPAGEQFGQAVPGNAHVERFIPHGPVLDRSVCAITHGGMGATQKALARGVPVCAVPFGRDQFEVARRVQVAGAGTQLAAARLRPDRLRAKVREAMTHADGARRVANGYAAAGGAAAAADAFEKRLLGQDRQHQPASGHQPGRWGNSGI
ncbi:MAG TPA: glycosyltransferase [Streptosporangiaceae bacterium]|jgi:MGT family glycosyltransferase